ncbi:7267_t:CDS:2 [Diversispora eburnea]|uniref:7267_t:CDS:1 n=1 Tax=Diversispora eburnea TaxID=1213867 RepID=A0A9N8V389_9GLOM|nr:7267_t:CDS:2 [Diversispora eburnea]
MKAKTLQIRWHKDSVAIYSVHFQPGRTGRFATGGMDNNVMIWKLVKNKKSLPYAAYLSTLNRHSAPVNVVRFSPKGDLLASAGDENNDSRNSFGENNDDEFNDSESWKAMSLLRGSLSEITDLAWSPDGEYIIAACAEGAARIWRVKDGVAWDPLGEYIATQGCDRSVHIYSYNVHPNGTFVTTHISKNYRMEIPHNQKEVCIDKTPKIPKKYFRLFCEEVVNTFFRRLTFTPDGGLLLTPAGQYPDSVIDMIKIKEKNNIINSPMKNTVYLFARNRLDKSPIALLPGYKKPSVVVKCSPVLYKLRFIKLKYQVHDNVDSTKNNSSSKFSNDDPNGKLPSNYQIPPLFDLPYRVIYAVATQDSIFIYDTEQHSPLAMATNLHYASISDLDCLTSHPDYSIINNSMENGSIETTSILMSKQDVNDIQPLQQKLSSQEQNFISEIVQQIRNGVSEVNQSEYEIPQGQKKRRITPKLIKQFE